MFARVYPYLSISLNIYLYSDDGRYIICGSEDRNVYMWNTDQSGMHTSKSSGGGFLLKKDKVSYEYFEGNKAFLSNMS